MRKLIFLLLPLLLFPLCTPVYADAENEFGSGFEAYDKEDFQTAFKKFKSAAEQGHADAQWLIGMMYKYGQGVTLDYKEAVKWYRLSAEQGEAKAQLALGLMYNDGQGVIQDYVQAHKWFSISAVYGDKIGHKKRGIVEKLMTPYEIAKSNRLARKWMRKHKKK